MPKNKAKAKAKNLGHFAVKRKASNDADCVDEHPRKRVRSTAPCPSSRMDSGRSSDIDMPLDIAVDSDEEDTSGIISDDEDTPDIEVHEENDVPHPKNQADLATWLKLSDDYLAGLQTNPVPLHRGSYHSRKVGKGVSVRRGQELKKIERERQAREDREDAHHRVKKTQIINFFSALAKPSPRETETVDAASNNEDGVVADVGIRRGIL
ncbi:hypothetical protein B0H14DRAFT_2614661 [Mycena olivaceomarginata]|nr:hypothetical protein B0H14DRAFT_2614661 [Mycena olivaceomarginata]